MLTLVEKILFFVAVGVSLYFTWQGVRRIIQNIASGFGIVQDDMNSGFMEQIKSDWLSKFAKAWKHEAERIADNAGRLGRPIVAFHDDMFSGIRELPAAWLGDNGVLDKIPVRFIRNDAMSNRPWECWDSAYHQSR